MVKRIYALIISGETFTRNREAAMERNASILRIGLVSAIAIFGLLFAESFLVPSFAFLRMVYLVIVALCAGMLALLRVIKTGASLVLLYMVHAALMVYATLTSAFSWPNDLCVTVLALLFLCPVLYLDKSWRVNGYELLAGCGYLIAISSRKAPDIFTEECMNVVSFTIVSILIGTFVRRAQMENLDMKRQLEDFAYTDQLTALPNRRSFFQLLTQSEAPDCPSPITAFAMMDIDNFKQYNDRYGHQAGDNCLRQLGECLRRFEEQYGVAVFRYGGEELVAANKTWSRETFLLLCETLRREVETLRPDGHAVTLSIGVAFQTTPGDRRYEALLQRSDQALYQAKNAGKNRVVCHEADQEAYSGPVTFRQRG